MKPPPALGWTLRCAATWACVCAVLPLAAQVAPPPLVKPAPRVLLSSLSRPVPALAPAAASAPLQAAGRAGVPGPIYASFKGVKQGMLKGDDVRRKGLENFTQVLMLQHGRVAPVDAATGQVSGAAHQSSSRARIQSNESPDGGYP
jgi:hypothetical protein